MILILQQLSPEQQELLMYCSGPLITEYVQRAQIRLPSAWMPIHCQQLLQEQIKPYVLPARHLQPTQQPQGLEPRSEERRVGKECRSRWSQYQERKKQENKQRARE